MTTKKQFWVEKEIFEIPYGGDSIIYAPLRKVVFLANKNLVNLICDIEDGGAINVNGNKNTITRLKKLGIIHERPEASVLKTEHAQDYDQPFWPANITLFLTSDCNLACLYCYGGGGDKKVNMPIEMGLDAIDLLFLNAAKSGAKQVHLGFHGGGEPVLRLRAMKRLVDHARQLSRNRKVGLTLGLTTNAVMSREAAFWVADNIDQLNISFDGPEDIQNYQRPMKNGGDSFKRVVGTLKTLETKEKKYNIRATVTQFSQDRIPEIVGFFTDNFMSTGVHVEPMFFSPRATKCKIKEPDKNSFTKGFLEGAKIAEKKGIPFYFSGDRFPKISTTFCGIGWKNFAVTPEGNVTSCFEVLSQEDPRSSIFFFGKYIPNKGFSLDHNKIIAIRKMSKKEFPFCRNCFAKFHCAGDCRAKGLYLNDISEFQGGGRCDIIQEITRVKLIEQLNLKRGNQYGRRKEQ
jgi:uncharacterized protein